jgi:hypothetical protein
MLSHIQLALSPTNTFTPHDSHGIVKTFITHELIDEHERGANEESMGQGGGGQGGCGARGTRGRCKGLLAQPRERKNRDSHRCSY